MLCLPAEGLRAELLAAGKTRQGDVVGSHCMAPACLEASLDHSLAALNLQTVIFLTALVHLSREQPECGLVGIQRRSRCVLCLVPLCIAAR